MTVNDHPEHDHTRACTVHDTQEHWTDDYAYTDEDKPTRDIDTVPRWSDILGILAQHKPEGDPYVSRFAMAYVNYDTGKIELLGQPGANIHSSINLLSRAISILAFQEDLRNTTMEDLAKSALGELFREYTEPETDQEIGRMYP